MYQCLSCKKEFKPYADDHPFHNWVIHRECGNWAAKMGSIRENVKLGERIVDIVEATHEYVEKTWGRKNG